MNASYYRHFRVYHKKSGFVLYYCVVGKPYNTVRSIGHGYRNLFIRIDTSILNRNQQNLMYLKYINLHYKLL